MQLLSSCLNSCCMALWVACRHRQVLAAQMEEERRQQLQGKLEAKQQRVAALEAEKAAMLSSLESMRREIRMQEDNLK